MAAVLLPSGLFDLLPPQAAAEAHAARHLLTHFAACGYQQVTPTLVEYEDSLFGGKNQAASAHSFRIMDPISQRMMAVRADMTMQIARIAGSTLAHEPRPLRLCYAGQTLRTTAQGLRSARQFRQIGIELFGANSVQADVEVIQTATAALMGLGLGPLSVDINLGGVFDALVSALSAADKAQLTEAVSRKDSKAIEAFNLPLISELIAAAGPAATALKKLETLTGLPPALAAAIADLKQAVTLLAQRFGDALSITIDPLELRGFGYYCGIGFSLFLKNEQVEVGRGGRYQTEHQEQATGFTLYTEHLVSVLPIPAQAPLVLLASDTTETEAQRVREQGYRTCYAVTASLQEEAKTQQIRHIYRNHKLEEIA